MKTDHLVFSSLDRVSILTDAFAMSRVGLLDYEKLFDLLQYLKKEKSYSPTVVALSGLNYILHMSK